MRNLLEKGGKNDLLFHDLKSTFGNFMVDFFFGGK